MHQLWLPEAILRGQILLDTGTATHTLTHTIHLLAAVMLIYLLNVYVAWIVLYAFSVEILGKGYRKPHKMHSNPPLILHKARLSLTK